MSSTTIPVSSSDATLIVGTPQHEEYYYKKIEECIYDLMAVRVARSPNISMTKTWLFLGEEGQRALIHKTQQILGYGKCRLDIEDHGAVSETTMTLIGFQLADMAFPSTAPKKSIGKDHKKSANQLLKTAIRHARDEKQGQ